MTTNQTDPPRTPPRTVALDLHREDLGHGSSFVEGVLLNFEEHTFVEFRAYQCNCSEEAYLDRFAESLEVMPFTDEEEDERQLMHDHLVDEYLRQYSQDPTISGLTFTEWAERFAPKHDNQESPDGEDTEADGWST